MKLRPTKHDYKVLDNLKVQTSQQTYTKAIMIAARRYPELLKKIKDLEDSQRFAWGIVDQFKQSAGFVLDGLEALKRIRKEVEEY